MIAASINALATVAIDLVAYKFPDEFNNPQKYGHDIFELIEMVADELASKNVDIFVKPFLDLLVDVKDVEWGEPMSLSEVIK